MATALQQRLLRMSAGGIGSPQDVADLDVLVPEAQAADAVQALQTSMLRRPGRPFDEPMGPVSRRLPPHTGPRRC